MKKLLSRAMVVLAIIWAVLLFFAFIAVSLYNTWSPGCALACIGESDQFEVKLIITCCIGLIVEAALWAVAINLDEEL